MQAIFFQASKPDCLFSLMLFLDVKTVPYLTTSLYDIITTVWPLQGRFSQLQGISAQNFYPHIIQEQSMKNIQTIGKGNSIKKNEEKRKSTDRVKSEERLSISKNDAEIVVGSSSSNEKGHGTTTSGSSRNRIPTVHDRYPDDYLFKPRLVVKDENISLDDIDSRRNTRALSRVLSKVNPSMNSEVHSPDKSDDDAEVIASPTTTKSQSMRSDGDKADSKAADEDQRQNTKSSGKSKEVTIVSSLKGSKSSGKDDDKHEFETNSSENKRPKAALVSPKESPLEASSTDVSKDERRNTRSTNRRSLENVATVDEEAVVNGAKTDAVEGKNNNTRETRKRKLDGEDKSLDIAESSKNVYQNVAPHTINRVDIDSNQKIKTPAVKKLKPAQPKPQEFAPSQSLTGASSSSHPLDPPASHSSSIAIPNSSIASAEPSALSISAAEPQTTAYLTHARLILDLAGNQKKTEKALDVLKSAGKSTRVKQARDILIARKSLDNILIELLK